MGQLQKVSWRAVGYTALGTVLAAASVVAVVNSDGVRPTSLTSNTATRWLVDQVNDRVVLVDGLAGRVVAKIKTDSVTRDEVAVQGAGGAFLVGRQQGSLRTISTSKLQLGTAQPAGLLLESDAKIGVGASGLTILSPSAGRASVVAVGDITRPIEIPTAGPGSLVANDGSMWLLNETEAIHVNVDETTSTVPLRSQADHAVAIGAHAVVYDNITSTVRWLDGGDVPISGALSNPSEAKIQEPGENAPCVWVGSGNTLVCVGQAVIDQKIVIAGMNITSNDRFAVAGGAAVIVSATNEVIRIDLDGRRLMTAEQPTVPGTAGPLEITAAGNLIWLDDQTGVDAWVVHRFGVNRIEKDDQSAPTLDAQGQVAVVGEAGGGQSTGGGADPGDDEVDRRDDNNQDDPPKAVDDSVTARSGNTVTIPVTGNDYDPDGDAIAVSAVDKAGNGTTDVLNGSSVVYVPNIGYSGTDSFDYTIVDEHGNTATATVHVLLFPPGTPNQPPIARADQVKTRLGHAITIDVLANDIDPERDILTLSSFRESGIEITDDTGPTGLPALKYQPSSDKPGIYHFTYQAADPQGGTSLKTDVTVDVTDGPNEPPTANHDAIRLPVGVADDLDVLANDVDPDGDPLTITKVDPPDGVDAVLKGRQLNITLQPGALDRSVVQYTLSDGDPTHEVIGRVLVLRLDDTAPNRPPVANPDAERVVIGTSVKIPVTANDVDPDSDLIVLLTAGQPNDGGSTTVEGNVVRFTPNLPDITEPTPVTFPYTITDGNGHEVTGRVTVTVLVEALPRAPIARDDFADTFTDKAVNIDVLANDSDPSGGKPSLIGMPVCPGGGEALTTTDNRVTFKPPVGQFGTFRCSYTVSSIQGLLTEALIIITVTEAPAGNSDPVINQTAIQQQVNVGESLTISANATATDADSDALVFSSLDTPTIGQVIFAPGTSSFIYHAPPAGSADKSFEVIELDFTISDGHDGTVQGTFSIKLVNIPTTPESPVVKPSTVEIAVAALAGDTVVVNVVNELTDRNFGTTLTLTEATTDSGPGVARVVNGDASIATTGPGTVVVTYTVENSAGGVASDKIRITLTQPPQPEPPVAADDEMTISSGGSNSVNLLANDSGLSDPGDNAEVALKNRPPATFGSVSLTNGVLAFVAAPQASGVVVLTYILRDGSGLTDEGDVTLTLQQCAESPPSARDGTVFTPYQMPINIDLNELVESGNIIPSSVSGAGLTGPTGIYTPPPGMNGTETVTFTVANGCRQTHGGQLVIDVNRAPIGGSLSLSAEAGGAPGSLVVDDFASDDELLNIVDLNGNPEWATLQQPTGRPGTTDETTIRIAPPRSVTGLFTFTAIVQDPGGLTASAAINVTVSNQPPIARPDEYTTPDSLFLFNPTSNDSDPEGGQLTIRTRSVTSSNGSEIRGVTPDHTFTIQLGPGITTLDYTIEDEGGLTASSTITITLTPPPPSNRPPIVPDIDVTVSGGEREALLTMVVTEPDGDLVEFECNDHPADFEVTVTGPNESGDPTQHSFDLVIAIPDGFGSGDSVSPALIRCTATDPAGLSGTGTITITKD